MKRAVMKRSVMKRSVVAGGFLILFLLSFILFFRHACLTPAAGERWRGAVYSSIRITREDTLEGIASRLNEDLFESDDDYIQEILSLNGMVSRRLHPGCYLTVIRRGDHL